MLGRSKVRNGQTQIASLEHNESALPHPDGSLPVVRLDRPARGRPILLSSGPVREWRF
jgi:hypothetical protein